MAEMAVQGLLEFWPCKSVNNPNFGLPIRADFLMWQLTFYIKRHHKKWETKNLSNFAYKKQ